MRSVRFVAILLACSAAALAQTLPAGTDPAKDIGKNFVRQLSQGQFADAATLADDSVKSAISPEALKFVWADLSKGKGNLKEIGTPTVSAMLGVQAVLVPCEWEHGRCRLKVVLNSKLRLVGLFVVPPAINSAGIRPAYLDTAVTTREVTVGRKPWELPGTLTLPSSGKPVAAVVMVQGSGPSDRDETIGPNKPFRDLALGLAKGGVASLRYEKRTHHYRQQMAAKEALLRLSGQSSSITVEQEVLEDALLALKTLRAQPELAGVPTYVLGHSLGGILAPEIASRDGQVAGAILLAAPARAMEDVVIDQFRYGASLSPGPEASAKVEALVRDVERVRNHTAKPNDIILSGPASYWYDLSGHVGTVALKTAAGFKGRLLVVQGGRDYQSTTEDFKLWQAELGKNRRATLKLFPNLNHLFAAGEGKARPDEYNDEDHVDPQVIELIAGWCGKP